MKHGNLIVFDLGRVLVRICDNWRHACEVARVPVPVTDLDDAGRAAMMKLVIENECGRMEQRVMARAAAPVLGIQEDHFLALSDAYLLGPYEGAPQLLDDLHAAGHVTACLSNTNANHWRIMTDPADPHGRALARLRHPFASHLIGTRKPDPAIYAHVERTTGFAPAQIVYFDDAPENLPPAQARGWTTHLVPRCENPIRTVREVLETARIL